MNQKDIIKSMDELFNSVKNDSTLVPKAREMNKAISNIISYSKAKLEYSKAMNVTSKIDIFENENL